MTTHNLSSVGRKGLEEKPRKSSNSSSQGEGRDGPPVKKQPSEEARHLTQADPERTLRDTDLQHLLQAPAESGRLSNSRHNELGCYFRPSKVLTQQIYSTLWRATPLKSLEVYHTYGDILLLGLLYRHKHTAA